MPFSIIPILMILFGFIFIPLQQLSMLSMMPGNIGDARLNNYFLENTYQFLIGGVDSLWNLGFFSPFPYVIGFSDNLFGTSPVYILARILDFKVDTSFQIWFIFGYVFNFAACFYALRRLNSSIIASSVGALIFAFALPIAAHAGHAQLHYRFGLPLSIVFFILFVDSKKWSYLLVSAWWMVWQFFAGVYIGFFTLLMLSSVIIVYAIFIICNRHTSIGLELKKYFLSWRVASFRSRLIFFVILVLLFALMLVLFYPYFMVSNLYGAKRSWDEISTMLPRPQSYFLADNSLIWSIRDAELFSKIPMRHEHQMFMGLIPIVLAIFGFFIGIYRVNRLPFILLSGMLALLIVSTLYVGGVSFWYFLHDLPLFSAIRVMSRLDQAFLFPIAFLAAIFIDYLRVGYRFGVKLILIIIAPLIIAESALSNMDVSDKNSWRDRVEKIDHLLPNNLDGDSILFFAQRSGPPFADELDAMWVSLLSGKKTMNGYSGLYPPGYDYLYGSDCNQIPKRVLSYLNFMKLSDDLNTYRELMSRIVPVGFYNCNDYYFQNPPSSTTSSSIYTAKQFSALGYKVASIDISRGESSVTFSIVNSGDDVFSFASATGNPIKISWRYIDQDGSAITDWDNRIGLPFDIPSNGELQIIIPLVDLKESNVSAVEISLVQEGVFWLHDIGLPPAKIYIKK